MSMKLKFLLILGGIVLFVGANSIITVDEKEQKLIRTFGGDIKTVITEAGLHFKVPFAENIIRLEKRVLNTETDEIQAILVDKKQLVVDTFARYKIMNPLRFYQTIGNEANANIKLKSIIESATRGVLGKRSLKDILSGERQVLMEEIREAADRETENLGLKIVDVRIRRADLPPENSQFVFNRMKAERQQKAAQFRAEGKEKAVQITSKADRESQIIIANAKKDAEIIRGEGDQERNRIYAESFAKDKNFFEFYRSMQAYESTLGKNSDTSVIMSTDTEFLKFLHNGTRN
ncbi:MAG: protease modulator HflC [Pseudomonadota bacterium]